MGIRVITCHIQHLGPRGGHPSTVVCATFSSDTMGYTSSGSAFSSSAFFEGIGGILPIPLDLIHMVRPTASTRKPTPVMRETHHFSYFLSPANCSLAKTREIMVISFMRMFREGPEVSLNGSPMVSPVTVAA